MQVAEWLSIVDIKDLDSTVSIHSNDIKTQGLIWNFSGKDVYLADHRLCMGISSSPYIFQRISNCVVHFALREGINIVINYLDDFSIIEKEKATVHYYRLY